MSNNEYALESFNYSKSVYDYYLGSLAFLIVGNKDQEQKMYQECKIAFDAVEETIKDFFPSMYK